MMRPLKQNCAAIWKDSQTYQSVALDPMESLWPPSGPPSSSHQITLLSRATWAGMPRWPYYSGLGISVLTHLWDVEKFSSFLGLLIPDPRVCKKVRLIRALRWRLESNLLSPRMRTSISSGAWKQAMAPKPSELPPQFCQSTNQGHSYCFTFTCLYPALPIDPVPTHPPRPVSFSP